MKLVCRCLVMVLLCAGVAAETVRAESVPFDAAHWEINDPKARFEDHLGRKSIYLTSGYAMLKDVILENGVIEVDIAASNVRAFLGIHFHLENPGDFETVYFRPHKSGLEDAVQYAPSFNGSTAWQLYSGDGYTTAVEIPKGEWIHTRIEVSGLVGKVYFNNSDKPVLVITDLKRGYGRGSIAVWGGAQGGHFSNFTYRTEPSGDRREKAPWSVAAGILAKWELSEAFDSAQRNPETLPSAAELKAMKWQPVGVESPGMVVINRYRKSPDSVPFFTTAAERLGPRPGRAVVFARTVIYSDSDQVKKMSIGYSDEATVFVNASPVFTGRSAFRFRDPGFLGIMNVEDDAVYLPLKKGRNEVILGVADYFGGWGFICRLDDTRGIRTETP